MAKGNPRQSRPGGAQNNRRYQASRGPKGPGKTAGGGRTTGGGGTNHKGGNCCPMAAAIHAARHGKFRLATRYARWSIRLIATRTIPQ